MKLPIDKLSTGDLLQLRTNMDLIAPVWVRCKMKDIAENSLEYAGERWKKVIKVIVRE